VAGLGSGVAEQNIAPGWYPDPGGSGGHRWWDGLRWTNDLAPGGPPHPPQQGQEGQGGQQGSPPRETPVARQRPGRQRRWLLTALIAVVGIAGAVGALIALGVVPGTEAAGEGGFPDIVQPPSAVWELDTEPLFAQTRDHLLSFSRGSYVGEAIRTSNEVLGVASTLRVWSAGPGRAVLLPSYHGSAGRLHGLNTRDGSLTWESELLTVPGVDSLPSITCEPGAGAIHCLALTTVPGTGDDLDWTAALWTIDLADGATIGQVDLGRGEQLIQLAAVVHGAALITRSSERAGEISLVQPDGSARWQRAIDGAWELHPQVRGDWVFLNADDQDGGWRLALDVATGDVAHGFDLGRSSPDTFTITRSWGPRVVLQRNEHSGDGTLRTTVTLYDGDEERCQHSGAAQLDNARVGELPADAPLLVVEDGSHDLLALDVATCEVLWRTRTSGGALSLRHVDRHTAAVSDGGELMLLDRDTGERRWAEHMAEVNDGSGFADRTVYLLEERRTVRALDLSGGSHRWSWTAPPGPAGVSGGELRQLGGELAFVRADMIQVLR
jgi:outer membrane protein assembly factor BamB